VLLVLAAALGGDALSATDPLRWGADSEGGAPYVFPDPKDPRRIMGFEVDIAGALGRELGRPAVFVQNQWDGLIPGLLRGNYDVALNGLEIRSSASRSRTTPPRSSSASARTNPRSTPLPI